MQSHTCPFCGQTFPLLSETFQTFELSFDGPKFARSGYPRLGVRIFRCANAKCGLDSVEVKGLDGYIEETFVNVYPGSSAIHFPEYVPEAIRADYEEACAIYKKSPKAAATLARRCLQGMIRDCWGIKKGRLVDEVEALKDKVPSPQWDAIEALRKIGNISAHMKKDVNLIIDVEPSEAKLLISLIESLIREWYISRHNDEELYKSISAIAREKEFHEESQSPSRPPQS